MKKKKKEELHHPNPTLNPQQGLINRQLQLDAHIRDPRKQEAQEIERIPQSAAQFADGLDLLLVDGAGGVAGEDEEGAEWALARV